MKKTSRVHCLNEPYDVYIGRGSLYGNPFKIGRDGTRAECVQLYKDWVLQHPEVLDTLSEIKGLRLGCWCKENEACHGDVLIELIESAEHQSRLEALFGKGINETVDDEDE